MQFVREDVELCTNPKVSNAQEWLNIDLHTSVEYLCTWAMSMLLSTNFYAAFNLIRGMKFLLYPANLFISFICSIYKRMSIDSIPFSLSFYNKFTIFFLCSQSFSHHFSFLPALICFIDFHSLLTHIPVNMQPNCWYS